MRKLLVSFGLVLVSLSLSGTVLAEWTTWKDPNTGLTWMVEPSGQHYDWKEAISYCRKLSLEGEGWRLPTINELRTLIRGCPSTATGGSCKVTDSCLSWGSCSSRGTSKDCKGCSGSKGPTNGCYWPKELQGKCDFYWSSSPVEDRSDFAWYVQFYTGSVYDGSGMNFPIRCVR
jgi:uncharacterized protein (TIGR02145 family)